MRKLLSYLRFKRSKELSFFKVLRTKTGINFNEYYDLKFKNKTNNLTLFGKKIEASNAFWHLHSLNEVFVDETYKFNAKSSSPLILDCGSNIGLSIIYFKKNYPNARVIGFEPDPTIFSMLVENIKQFEMQNVELINKAVWTDNGELTFNSTGALGGTLNLIANDVKPDKTNNVDVIVKTIRLRDYLEKDKVDFLKIDIEGAEFNILEDCLDVLNNVENLFIEYHRPKGSTLLLGDFISKLENAGFNIYIKEAWNNLPHPYCSKDYSPMYDLQLNIFGYRK